MDCYSIAYQKTILVLNATYEPLHQTSWKRARVLVIKNKAHVISSRTIRLKNYVKVPPSRLKVGKPTRALILKRDDHTCQYCDYKGPNLTLDHVIPRSKGGGETWQNLVASCLECNNCKDDRTPEEWADSLKAVFNRKSSNVSVLPRTWDSFQVGMMEARVRSRGTTLSTKPKAPHNKISVSIRSSENAEEWGDYLYS